MAKTQNLAAIDAALRATLRVLSAREFSQRQAGTDAGYVKQRAVEHPAHAVAANPGAGQLRPMGSLDQTLATMREMLATSEAPSPAVLAGTLTAIEVSLRGGISTLLGT